MAENQAFSFADSIREARQRWALELRAQAEQIRKINLELTELQQLQERIEQEASPQWDEITRAAALAATASEATALDNVLGAIRTLMTCTIPEQVFAILTEEASQWGVRAAIFDVRGKAAWGASAHGFEPTLSETVFRSLVVPLNKDNPFRQVCETAGPVDASTDTLKKNRNVLDKLKPAPHAPVLLLPIRSAGTVAAIFYADPGEKGQALPVNALKILAEFAGAQIDRLIALSGGFSTDEVKEKVDEAAAPVEESLMEVAAGEPVPAEPYVAEPAVEEPVVEELVAGVHTEVEAGERPALAPEPEAASAQVTVGPPEPVVAVAESEPAPAVVEQPLEVFPSPPMEPLPPAALAGFDDSQLSELEQKVHKDAKRFAKLLVSEIELYNKSKVAEGRKNRDLYERLKSDIDRSRQTFEKRFGKVLSKQFDYFHDELVKTLGGNDPSVLGPDYPGPSA